MEKETMESTWEKFQKELQAPTICGACGQYYEENQQGEDGYHNVELCDAADEICEICNARVTICTCQRCLECGTLYSESDAVALLDDDNNCATCADDKGE